MNEKLIDCASKSVLCWLATASSDGQANVSPKEIFKIIDEETIIIANIASPQSAKNINENEKVCVSFIDVLIQKGFKIYAKAQVINSSSSVFLSYEQTLQKYTKGLYPFKEIFELKISKIQNVIAPSYFVFPNKSIEERVEEAKIAYGLHSNKNL